jgi:hypothetical protein
LKAFSQRSAWAIGFNRHFGSASSVVRNFDLQKLAADRLLKNQEPTTLVSAFLFGFLVITEQTDGR